jgi:hypothetical protein
MLNSAQRLLVSVGFIFALLTLPSGTLHAENQWVIVPGKGLGPVYLGMDDTEALTYFPKPERVQMFHEPSPGRTEYKRVSYRNGRIELVFSRDTTASPYKLVIIDIYDKAYVTVQGVRVGSSIFEMFGAYGDTVNTVTQDSTVNFVQCMETSEIYSIKSVRFTFRYRKQGIEFLVDLTRGSAAPPSVAAMTIFPPEGCQ